MLFNLCSRVFQGNSHNYKSAKNTQSFACSEIDFLEEHKKAKLRGNCFEFFPLTSHTRQENLKGCPLLFVKKNIPEILVRPYKKLKMFREKNHKSS